MNQFPNRRHRILFILSLQVLMFYFGIPAFSQETKDSSAPKRKYQDLSIGSFRLDLGANIRLRHEFQDGFDVRKYAPDTGDQFLLTRVMFDINLRFDSDRRLFIQFRDAHSLGTRLDRGDFTKSNPIEDILDVRQAYFEWKKSVSSNFDLKVGRQQISYGDQRIFGAGLWGNTGRYAWDAALLHVDTHRLWLDAWVGRPIENRPELWPNRESKAPFAFVLYSRIKDLPFRFDVFYAGKYDYRSTIQGESGTGDLLSHSIGFQLQKPAGKGFDYSTSLIGQTGRYGKDAIRAFGVNSAVGATFPLKWNPRLAVQFTLGSGDHNPTDGIRGTFDGVFGGVDLNFYGDLNLFSWANLRDYEWDFHLQPTNSTKLFLEHHYFTLDQDRDAWYTTGLAALRCDKAGLSGNSLGHEINLRFSWQPMKRLEILMGLARFFPGSFVKATGPASPATGYFLQTAYGF
jgi:hypothetical protein